MARHVSAWLAKGVYSIDHADRCPLSPHKRRKSGHFLTAASCTQTDQVQRNKLFWIGGRTIKGFERPCC